MIKFKLVETAKVIPFPQKADNKTDKEPETYDADMWEPSTDPEPEDFGTDVAKRMRFTLVPNKEK